MTRKSAFPKTEFPENKFQIGSFLKINLNESRSIVAGILLTRRSRYVTLPW